MVDGANGHSVTVNKDPGVLDLRPGSGSSVSSLLIIGSFVTDKRIKHLNLGCFAATNHKK